LRQHNVAQPDSGPLPMSLIRNRICKELIPKRQQSMFLHPKLCEHSFRDTTDVLLSSAMHAYNTLNYSARSLIAIPMISLIQKQPQNLNLQNTSFDRFQTSYTLGLFATIYSNLINNFCGLSVCVSYIWTTTYSTPLRWKWKEIKVWYIILSFIKPFL
jgi:hypothetical protein